MYLIDTNVVSELMRPAPNDVVCRWFATAPASAIHTSSVTKAEILVGLLRLPEGARRSALLERAEDLFGRLLAGRVLPFSARSAELYAEVCATRRRLGRGISMADAQILSICKEHGMTLVSRDADLFEPSDAVACVNPWAW